MSNFPDPEENLDELHAQVAERFRKVSRRHLPPVRQPKVLAPPVRSSARLLAQAQTGTSSGPESSLGIEEKSEVKGKEAEVGGKETSPSQTVQTQQTAVADPTAAAETPSAPSMELSQPAPLAVTPPPPPSEVIDVDESPEGAAPDQPSRATEHRVTASGEKRVREETAASARPKRSKASAPLPPLAVPPQAFSGSSDGVLAGFTPRSFTQEEIEHAMNEVRQPGFHRTYREFIYKKNLLDICMEMDHAGLQQKLRERTDQSEAINRDRQKKIDEVNDAILARAAEATKYYAELQEKYESADQGRKQAEKDLALEKEASTAHLSNLSLLADQLKKANSDLAASQADLQSSQDEVRKLRVEQAESHLQNQRLASLNEQLVTEKDQLAASLVTSQNAVLDLTEANSQLRDAVADLKAKTADQELRISELNCSHIQYLRNWVSSPGYVEAFSYSAQTNYCVGYSNARVAIFEALNKLGMGDVLSPGSFRAYDDERMLATGQTLRRPVTKRPAVNPPGTPAADIEETEWEPPYSSPLPVAGELVDLHPDVYADLVHEYERRRHSARKKTSGDSEIVLKQLEGEDAAAAQAGKADDSGAES